MFPADALPREGITNWRWFTPAQSTPTTNSWQTYQKPAGCSWIYIFGLGAGGAGAKPANGALTTAGGGGGGGATLRMLIPAISLPDIIYIRVGNGVAPPVSPGAGSGGITSYISISPNTTAQNLVVSLNGGGGGQQTGAGGASFAASASSFGIWMNVGLFTSIGGQPGGAGAALVDTAGTAVTWGSAGVMTSGGAGGGNGTGAGGNITGAGMTPTISGGAGTTGGAGAQGFRLGQLVAPGFKFSRLAFTGGAGGGGHTTGAAGAGGNGSWGCGGGGGGAASGAGTSGNGGRGGDALILIGAF